MSDESMTMGGNAREELKRRVDRRIAVIDKITELQDEIKTFKAEDKSDGYNEKTIARAVKELRWDAEKILAQLTLEAEMDVVRGVVGLPTDIETASRLAQEEAEAVPEPRRGRAAESDPPDGTKH